MADGYIAKDIKNESWVVGMTDATGRQDNWRHEEGQINCYQLLLDNFIIFTILCPMAHWTIVIFNIAKKSLQFKFWNIIGENHRDTKETCHQLDWIVVHGSGMVG